jgi:protein-disulfide isomerase
MRRGTWTAVLVLAAAPLAPTETAGTVATVGGQLVSDAQLEELAASQLARVRADAYAIKKRALDDYIRQALLEQEARARHLSVPQLRQAEIDARVEAVSAEDVQAVLKTRGDGQTAEQVRAQLQQQRRLRREADFMKELRSRIGVEVLLVPPRVAIAGDGPTVGPARAPAKLVVFSDFQCPYCARVASVLKQVEAKYGDRVAITFRDYPLPMHRNATKAAEAGRCAADQGKYWTMQERMFANQQALDVPSLERYAGEAGLDAAALARCLEAGTYAAAVEADIAEGNKAGVSGTPSIFVNGRPLPAGGNLEAIVEAIDEELARPQRATAAAR